MKAILTIDMPDHCKNCPLHDISSMEGDWLCLAAGGKWIETQRAVPEQKPEWCPLRPLPEKEVPIKYSSEKVSLRDKAWTVGFNACIDVITGETE